MNGRLSITCGGVSLKPEFVEDAGPFRFDPPNFPLTPAQSVSTCASSRTEEPGTWRTGPEIAFGIRAIPGERERHVVVDLIEAPSERVFVMIPGACTLNSVASDRIGFML